MGHHIDMCTYCCDCHECDNLQFSSLYRRWGFQCGPLNFRHAFRWPIACFCINTKFIAWHCACCVYLMAIVCKIMENRYWPIIRFVAHSNERFRSPHNSYAHAGDSHNNQIRVNKIVHDRWKYSGWPKLHSHHDDWHNWTVKKRRKKFNQFERKTCVYESVYSFCLSLQTVYYD